MIQGKTRRDKIHVCPECGCVTLTDEEIAEILEARFKARAEYPDPKRPIDLDRSVRHLSNVARESGVAFHKLGKAFSEAFSDIKGRR